MRRGKGERGEKGEQKGRGRGKGRGGRKKKRKESENLPWFDAMHTRFDPLIKLFSNIYSFVFIFF